MHVGCPVLTMHVGLEILLGSRLPCSRGSVEDLTAQKASGARGWSLQGVEQGPGSHPDADIPEQRFPGRSLPGGQQQQQQDERRRRISLSGCFLKITLPLSAGQGCSRLNNRSGPALPCSQPGMCRVDAGAQPLAQHRCPQGLNGSKGTRCPASPTLLPPKTAAGDALSSRPRAGGSRGRNGSARGRSHRVFAKTAESRSNYSLNVSTFVAGMKDAHMRQAGSSPALPHPLKGRKRTDPAAFCREQGMCPGFGWTGGGWGRWEKPRGRTERQQGRKVKP